MVSLGVAAGATAQLLANGLALVLALDLAQRSWAQYGTAGAPFMRCGCHSRTDVAHLVVLDGVPICRASTTGSKKAHGVDCLAAAAAIVS